MSETLPTTTTIWPAVVVPDSADVLNVADLKAAYQALKDRTDRLHEFARGGNVGGALLSVPLNFMARDPVEWEFRHFTEPSVYPGGMCIQQVALGGVCIIPLPYLVVGTKIESVSFSCKGAGHGSVPATLPNFSLLRQSFSGTVVPLAAGNYTAGSLYDAGGTVGLLPNHTVEAANSYYLSIVGESGAGALVGASVGFGVSAINMYVSGGA